jgi:hypothetical protein
VATAMVNNKQSNAQYSVGLGLYFRAAEIERFQREKDDDEL